MAEMVVTLTVIIIAGLTIIASLFIPEQVSKNLEYKRKIKDSKWRNSDLILRELHRKRKGGRST